MGERLSDLGGSQAAFPATASLPAVEMAIRDARQAQDPAALERAAAMADRLAIGEGVVARRAASLADDARSEAKAMRPAGRQTRSVESGEAAHSWQWIWIVLITAAVMLGYVLLAAGIIGDRSNTVASQVDLLAVRHLLRAW